MQLSDGAHKLRPDFAVRAASDEKGSLESSLLTFAVADPGFLVRGFICI